MEDSQSPFKKPGYVVGGSSLALGLASITRAKSPPSGPAQPFPSQQLQEQAKSKKPSFESFSRSSADLGTSAPLTEQQHISASGAALSTRATRKHVDRSD
jgi:hypothetical protein